MHAYLLFTSFGEVHGLLLRRIDLLASLEQIEGFFEVGGHGGLGSAIDSTAGWVLDVLFGSVSSAVWRKELEDVVRVFLKRPVEANGLAADFLGGFSICDGRTVQALENSLVKALYM